MLFQINEQNKLFLEGKATFFEELNENSDLPKDVFEEEKEGDLFTPDGRALGEVDLDESEWYTHPELERLYQTVNRAEIPKSHDGRSLGKEPFEIGCLDILIESPFSTGHQAATVLESTQLHPKC